MKTNKLIIIMIFLCFIFNILPMTIQNKNNIATASDSVTWENQYGKLTVYPKTSRNLIKQKQYYEVVWYKPDNDLDIAFRFDEQLIGGGGVYYWNGTNYTQLPIKHTEYLNKHYYILEDIHFKRNQKITGYWEYNTPVNSKGKWDMYIKLHSDTFQTAIQNNRYVHLDPWWNSDWVYKKKITIDHNQIPEDMNNFPILINISNDPEIGNNVGYINGSDIVFTDGTETNKLNHEIEYFKIDPSSSNARLVTWVNITSISSTTDTNIYMYYGNKNCNNQSNPTGVWDTKYAAVYHMTGSDYTKITDSTSNNLDATSDNSNPIYNENSIAGYGVTFDGTNDFINLVDNDKLTLSVTGRDIYYTIEAVFKKTDSNNNPVISKYKASELYGQDAREWIFYAYTDNHMRMYQYDEGNTAPMYRTSTDTISNGVWTYAVGQWNSTSGSSSYQYILTYLNGFNNSDGGYKGTGYDYMKNTAQIVRIGCYETDYTTYNCFKGTIDEIRISKNLARNESWIEATYNTIFNATDGNFFTIHAEEGIGNIGPPTGFLATTDKDGNIDLNWTMDINATHTRIEYNTIFNWARGTGTLLYNGSGLTTSLTTASCNIRYYFRGWSYNSSQNNWSIAANNSNISCPGNPSNINVDSLPGSVNISWSNNTYSDNTLLIRKNGGYPTSPTDGTVLYNGTTEYYVDAGVIYGTTFYRLYSYNATINRYSSGINVPLTSLKVYVYDEETNLPLSGWGILIRNNDGTETYINESATNPCIIDTNEIPTGNNIYISVNMTDYANRTYYMDIEENQFYTLYCYLAKNNSVDYYMIRVIDELDTSVVNARIQIQRYINSSYGYQNISVLKTDGYGYATVSLIPGVKYLAITSKTGYITSYDNLEPIPIVFGDERYFIFQLQYNVSDIDYNNFISIINFCSYSGWNLNNNTFHIRYYDKNDETTNIQIKLYEYVNNTNNLLNTYNYNNNGDIHIWINGLNTSIMHKIVIVSMNHTTLGHIQNYICYVYPKTHFEEEYDMTWHENNMEAVGGTFEPGYINFFYLFVPTFLMMVGIGKYDPGLGIIVGSYYLSFCSWRMILINELQLYALLGIITPLAVLVIIIRKGKTLTGGGN